MKSNYLVTKSTPRFVDELLLRTLSYNLKSYGLPAFSVCATKLWNSLPLDIKRIQSLGSSSIIIIIIIIIIEDFIFVFMNYLHNLRTRVWASYVTLNNFFFFFCIQTVYTYS